MELKNAMQISASGMRAQGERLKIISENLANSDSLGKTPGSDPYRRKVVSFKSELDRAMGANLVKAQKPQQDRSDFELKYDPGHPSANADGYVKMPNVKSVIEMADMREAQRTYEANLNVIDSAKAMLNRTVDLLRQ
ncbi:flagellar basal body rod protein FlgC [Ferrovibrio terrae]|uniref:Flagellar basal-body rod protein FlgC n=1 Tax=Ferrovibrio terrae TaxID=2594003 RepID=A0A516H6J4_9PROT|nr:flagellar basal body rod protein FlgC [Ferrovibrio terrae]QDO99389.1 flagellar basal body rod protein FlgC [Ferrovibrio terrae]